MRLASKADFPRQGVVQIRPPRVADVPVFDLETWAEVCWRADSIIQCCRYISAAILVESNDVVFCSPGVECWIGHIRLAEYRQEHRRRHGEVTGSKVPTERPIGIGGASGLVRERAHIVVEGRVRAWWLLSCLASEAKTFDGSSLVAGSESSTVKLAVSLQDDIGGIHDVPIDR